MTTERIVELTGRLARQRAWAEEALLCYAEALASLDALRIDISSNISGDITSERKHAEAIDGFLKQAKHYLVKLLNDGRRKR